MNRALKWVAVISLATSATALLYDDDSTVREQPTQRARAQASSPAARARHPRLAASGPARNLFPAQDWSASHQMPTRATAPTVAPLPFTLTGVWQDNGARVIFVQDGQLVLALCTECETPGALRPGALLTGGYRLDAIESDQIEFTHLPDQQRQRLRIEQ